MHAVQRKKKNNKKPTIWRGMQNVMPIKFNPNAIFSNFDKRWSEVADDVIPGVTVDLVSTDAHANFGDESRQTVAELFDSLAGRTWSSCVHAHLSLFSAMYKSE